MLQSGAFFRSGDPSLLLNIAANRVKFPRVSLRDTGLRDDDEVGTEDEDDSDEDGEDTVMRM